MFHQCSFVDLFLGGFNPVFSCGTIGSTKKQLLELQRREDTDMTREEAIELIEQLTPDERIILREMLLARKQNLEPVEPLDPKDQQEA